MGFYRRRTPPPRVEIFTIASLFDTFIESVLSKIVSPNVNQWIDELNKNNMHDQAQIVQDFNDIMTQFGFNYDSNSPINKLNDVTYTYLMVTPDGFNACAPFLDVCTYSKNVLVEGPSLGALGVIANDYNQARQNNGVPPNVAAEETGTLLIPRAELQLPSVQRFNSSFDREAVYSTDGGELHINYERHPQEFAGRVTSYVVPNSRRRQIVEFAPVVIEFPSQYGRPQGSA